MAIIIPVGKPKVSVEAIPIPLTGKDAGKLPQDAHDVVYMNGTQGPFRCDHCDYFIKPNACELVAGKIEGAGCCNKFEKAKPQPTFKEAAMAALKKK